MMKKIICKIIPFKIRQKVKRKLFIKSFLKDLNSKRKSFNKCIVFIAVPTHGNLGDHAIVYSQYKIFEQCGLENNIIEIRNEDYLRFSDIIKEKLNQNDIIVIDGGGNIGTLWINEEYKIRDILKKFPDNKIIIFPETAYFSDDENGKKELEETLHIYNNHKNLNVCLRDKNSYELMNKNLYSCNVKYTPDIVLYLNDIAKKAQRNGGLLCIRKDKEKALKDTELIRIENALIKLNINYNYTTTVIDKIIYKNKREKELKEKLYEFSIAKFVITDRLHGMIFAAITGTPCIAINNSNGKVEGVYEWIKDLPYILFCNDFNKIEDYIIQVNEINERNCKYIFDKKNFKHILDMINN